MSRVSPQRVPLIVLVTVVFLITLASGAYAQATRTWVSGVGDDANPCSRTAPCKTFAGAISKTAAGGEINVLDPGGFGAVTITKSITISSESFEAGVLVSGTSGIIVNAGASDVVVLRGLDIEGLGTGLIGISFLAGGALYVEKCTINNFTQQGIDIGAGGATVSVKDSVIRNNLNAAGLGGIRLHPSSATTATLDNVRLEKNQIGLRVESLGTAIVHNSALNQNKANGITVLTGGEVDLDGSTVANNIGNGAGGSGTFKTATSSYYHNGANIQSGFTFTSLGNNHSDGSGGNPAAGTF